MTEARRGIAALIAVSLAGGCAVDAKAPTDEATLSDDVRVVPPTPVQAGQRFAAQMDRSHPSTTYSFHGTAGERISIFVDGDGSFDTVVSLYRLSRTTGRRTGAALALNDDTARAGWTMNPTSSSIDHFVLPETRDYAIVARGYDATASGHASVWFENDLPDLNAPPPFAGMGAATPLSFPGVTAAALPLGTQAVALAQQAQGSFLLVLARVQLSASDARDISADPARLGTLAFNVIYHANSSPPGIGFGDVGPAHVAPLRTADESVAALRTASDATMNPQLSRGEEILVASMLADGAFATGGVRLFQIHWDNGDDTNSEGIMAIDPASGEVRAVTYVNPP